MDHPAGGQVLDPERVDDQEPVHRGRDLDPEHGSGGDDPGGHHVPGHQRAVLEVDAGIGELRGIGVPIHRDRGDDGHVVDDLVIVAGTRPPVGDVARGRDLVSVAGGRRELPGSRADRSLEDHRDRRGGLAAEREAEARTGRDARKRDRLDLGRRHQGSQIRGIARTVLGRSARSIGPTGRPRRFRSPGRGRKSGRPLDSSAPTRRSWSGSARSASRPPSPDRPPLPGPRPPRRATNGARSRRVRSPEGGPSAGGGSRHRRGSTHNRPRPSAHRARHRSRPGPSRVGTGGW